ncbi:MAG: hypothetical protein AAF658_00105, partial [Myxococcota bacterium]
MKFYRFLLCGFIVVGAAACGDEPEPQSPFTFTVLSREEHEEEFPIFDSVHAAGDCNDCHGGF